MKVKESVFSNVLRRFHDVTSEEWKEKNGIRTAKIFTTEQKGCIRVNEYDFFGIFKGSSFRSWQSAEAYLKSRNYEPYEGD